ncbi:hypothetical protein J1N35_023014 [Gossypium stocksii]|uniref:Reverse transcriptase zinc-binding domain-containing protein n=1 Tax=Gossypium stocksii TaxID=47602 RepID=A0A9D3VHU9_9ROSI|nr:hypothetical protein J1N35_023014 [Gossypium stocksii]
MGSLISKLPSSYNLDLDCRVRDFINPNKGWNLDLFRVWLPEEVICKIISIPPPLPEPNPNRVIWAKSSSGAFSIRIAYWALKEHSWNPSNEQWKTIWKYLGPQRVRVFLWLAIQQRFFTNSERVRKGIGQSKSCVLCGCVFEDLAHALRDCPFAKDVWLCILPEEIKQSSSCWAQQYELRVSPNQRNDQCPNPANILDSIWVSLSTDGAVTRDTGYAASGGVARDHEGNWIMGFTHFLGVCSPFEAEV